MRVILKFLVLICITRAQEYPVPVNPFNGERGTRLEYFSLIDLPAEKISIEDHTIDFDRYGDREDPILTGSAVRSKALTTSCFVEDLLGKVSYRWNGHQWELNSQSYNTFTPEGNWAGGYHSYRNYEGIMISSKYKNVYNQDGKFVASSQLHYTGSELTGGYRRKVTFGIHGSSSIVTETWTGSDWEKHSRTIHTYNETGQETEYLNQDWSGTEWINTWRKISQYDQSGNLILEEHHKWSQMGEVVYFYSLSHSYDNSGLRTGTETRLFDGSIWNSTYTYDDNGNITEFYSTEQGGPGWFREERIYDNQGNETGYIWQMGEDNDVLQGSKYTTYKISNGMGTVSISQTWNGTEWDTTNYQERIKDEYGREIFFLYKNYSAGVCYDGYETTTVFDLHGKVELRIQRRWHENRWINNKQSIYAYDIDQRLISIVIKQWNTGTSDWYPSSQYLKDHESEKDRVITIFQTWNGGKWKNYRQTTETYDSHGHVIQLLKLKWNDEYARWENVEKTYQYWHDDPTDAKDQPVFISKIQNYPNPFNNETNIMYLVHEKTNVQVEIYNILGQKVFSQSNLNRNLGYHEVKWNGTNDAGSKVGAGMYFCRIQAGKQTEKLKLVLLK